MIFFRLLDLNKPKCNERNPGIEKSDDKNTGFKHGLGTLSI